MSTHIYLLSKKASRMAMTPELSRCEEVTGYSESLDRT